MDSELQAARKGIGLTQAQVAEASSISKTQYQNIEYNKNEPRVRAAIRIAETLGVQKFEDFKRLFGAATPIQKKPDGNRACLHQNNSIQK